MVPRGVTVLDTEGMMLGNVDVTRVREAKEYRQILAGIGAAKQGFE